jgi:MYXO-CTERM domain-containing protein
MIWTVDSSGSGGDFLTITEAIEVAADGDTIEVWPGTYAESLDYAGKAVTIRGTGGSAVTMLTSADVGVTFDEGEPAEAVLEGFTVTAAEHGVVVSGASPTIRDLVVTGSGGTGLRGGGVYVVDGSPAISDCELRGNTGDYGGAAWVEGVLSDPVFTDCVFAENTAQWGGALLVQFDSATSVVGCTFEANSAGQGGGAVGINDRGRFTSTDTDYVGNVADVTHGAAIFADPGSIVMIDGGEVSGNGSAGWETRENWGSVWVNNTTLIVTGVTFATNQAWVGSAIAAYTGSDVDVSGSTFDGNSGGSGGAIATSAADSLTITGSTFTGNTALNGGGALWLDQTGGVTVSTSTFCGNTSDTHGGAVWEAAGTLSSSWSNVVFADNTAPSGGAARWEGGTVTVTNATFVGNTAPDGAAAWMASDADVTFVNTAFAHSDGSALYALAVQVATSWSLFWGNTTDAGGALPPDVVTDGAGNVFADPLLVAWSDDGDCANDDFTPAVGSPLVDAGDPSLTDANGTVSDIGAYGGPAALLGDADADGWFDHLDCDDADASVFPGAAEVPDDGIDQDCDGADTITPDTDVDTDTGGETDLPDTDVPTSSRAWAPGGDTGPTDPGAGCGCASGPPGSGLAALLALLALRRRR